MNVNISAVTALFDKQKITSDVDQHTLSQQQKISSSIDDDVHALASEMATSESLLMDGNWKSNNSGGNVHNAVLPGYPSHSEADLALATKIAIEAIRLDIPTERLLATVEAVFGQSMLAQRDKWQNRADYREGTIQKAVESAISIQADAGLKSIEHNQGTAPKLLNINDGKVNLSKEDPQPRDWVLELILLAYKSGVIGGLGGTSKTQFILQLAIAKALGETFMGLTTKQGKSFLLLAEEDKAEAERRINAEIRYKDRSASEIQQIESSILVFGLVGQDTRLSRKLSGGLVPTEMGEEIIQLVNEMDDVHLIVLDHAGLIHGGDFNAREDVAQTMRVINHIAEETGASVLLLAHSPKSAKNDEESDASQVAGSTAFVDQARSALILATMRKPEAKIYDISDDTRKSYISLTVAKNNYGPTGDVYWFKRHSYDGVGLLEYVTLSKPPPALKGGPALEQKIRDFVASHRGQFSKTRLRESHGGKGGRFKVAKGHVEAAVENMLGDGQLILRKPTQGERDQFGHTARVTHVLGVGKTHV